MDRRTVGQQAVTKQPGAQARVPAGASVDVATEAKWIAGIRAGQDGAFKATVLAYGPGLAAFAARIAGSVAEAEEIVQDVFLRIWVRRAEFVVRDTLRAYLYRAVHNAALNVCRTGQVAAEWSERMAGESRAESELAEGERSTQQLQLAEAVERALAALPERCRVTFLLVRARGLSYAEAAEVMGVSVRTVDTQLTRAIKSLRESLKGVWP